MSTNSTKIDPLVAFLAKCHTSTPRTTCAKRFSVFEGDLWDERTHKVLRKRYASHHCEIKTTAHLLASLRAGQFAWPGGYEVFFYTADGATLSFEAVLSELRQICEAIRNKYTRSGWCVVACECAANVDGPITCDHTGREIVPGAEETE